MVYATLGVTVVEVTGNAKARSNPQNFQGPY